METGPGECKWRRGGPTIDRVCSGGEIPSERNPLLALDGDNGAPDRPGAEPDARTQLLLLYTADEDTDLAKRTNMSICRGVLAKDSQIRVLRHKN